MAITITFPSFGEFNALFKASHFKKRELGILPSFTMCFPLQKAVGLLLGLSAIYRWRYLGRSRLTTPYSVSIRGYPVGRYPAYHRCVNGPAYPQSFLYWGYPLIPECPAAFLAQTRIQPQRLCHIWPDSPGHSTAGAV